MPIMNSNQILQGARRPGLSDTYVTSFIKSPSVATVAGSVVTFTGGQIEFDGVFTFPLTGTLDFADIASLLPRPATPSTACFIVFAVPKYDEPLSRSDAEANYPGLNYYVTNSGSDSLLYYFIPSAIEALVQQAGGLTYLEDAVTKGTATNQETQVLNRYWEAYEKTSSPLYVGHDLTPTGIEYVVALIHDSPTVPSADATAAMTRSELLYYLSSQGDVPADMQPTVYTLTSPTAGTYFTGPAPSGFTIPGSKIYKMKTTILYPSLADANANTNGYNAGYLATPQDLADVIALLQDPDGAWAWPVGTIYATTWEYKVPSYLPPGQRGYKPQVDAFYKKEDSLLLGRVNPIYMGDPNSSSRLCRMGGPKSALMDYACPASLVKVCGTVDATATPTVVTLSTVTDSYDYIWGV